MAKTKPDWGHGPNQPVRTYTVDKIEQVLRAHGPVARYDEDEGANLECRCSATAGRWPDGEPRWSSVDWNELHFFDELGKVT